MWEVLSRLKHESLLLLARVSHSLSQQKRIKPSVIPRGPVTVGSCVLSESQGPALNPPPPQIINNNKTKQKKSKIDRRKEDPQPPQHPANPETSAKAKHSRTTSADKC